MKEICVIAVVMGFLGLILLAALGVFNEGVSDNSSFVPMDDGDNEPVSHIAPSSPLDSGVEVIWEKLRGEFLYIMVKYDGGKFLMVSTDNVVWDAREVR